MRPADGAAPGTGGLVDRHGRVATDLRVSLTDRCNLRCTYCMPPEGLDWLPKVEVLTDDEIVRLVRIGVEQLGIREVRFTGGEPLLRPGPGRHRRRPRRRCARGPRSASPPTRSAWPASPRRWPRPGWTGSTSASTPSTATGSSSSPTATGSTTSSPGSPPRRRAGLTPVKVNAVLLRGINEEDAVPLLDFCLEHGYQLRFIEQMPLDAHHAWTRGEMVTAEDILERLSAAHTLTPDSEERGSAPAERWLVDGGPATVGVIASVTRSFCGTCDRTRLTADGQIRNCLFAREESDLRTPMREGATDAELADRWRIATLAQAARARHRRPELPAADPADVGHRRLSMSAARVTVRYFAGARAAAGVDTETRDGRRPSTSWSARSSTRTASGWSGCSPPARSSSTAPRPATARWRCHPGAVVDVLPPFAGG